MFIMFIRCVCVCVCVCARVRACVKIMSENLNYVYCDYDYTSLITHWNDFRIILCTVQNLKLKRSWNYINFT